jgi:acyl transferase domain-containing protein
MLLLAPAAMAATAGRGPAALVLGSAVNQDGRSSSLTAPNGPAQQEAAMAALTDAGMLAGSVNQLSLHGTGTPLGECISAASKSELVTYKSHSTLCGQHLSWLLCWSSSGNI